MLKSAHIDGIARDLAHVNRIELPDLSRDGVFFDERFLGEVKLQWVVGRERNVHPALEELFKRRLNEANKRHGRIGRHRTIPCCRAERARYSTSATWKFRSDTSSRNTP